MHIEKLVRCLAQSQPPQASLCLQSQISHGAHSRSEVGCACKSNCHGKVFALQNFSPASVLSSTTVSTVFPIMPLVLCSQIEPNSIVAKQHSAFFEFLAECSKHNFPFADAVNCTNAHVILFRLWLHPVLTIMLPLYAGLPVNRLQLVHTAPGRLIAISCSQQATSASANWEKNMF